MIFECQKSVHGFFQILPFKRFAQMVIHARCQTAGNFLRLGTGSQSQNWQRRMTLFAFKVPEPSGGFVTIEHRHFHVHQHHGKIVLLFQQGQGLTPIADTRGMMPQSAKQGCGEQGVDFGILHKKDVK